MRIYVKKFRGFNSKQDINTLLIEHGFDVLITCKNLHTLTQEILKDKYDFNNTMIDYFFNIRDDITYKYEVIECNVEPSDTIESCKECVFDKTGIPVNQLRFIYRGYQLYDDRTFSDYNIGKDSIIEMTLRLRGD